jgi:hypothetical protein
MTIQMKKTFKIQISKALSVLIIISILLSSAQSIAFAKNDKGGTTNRIMVQYKHGTPNSEKKIKNINSKKYKRLKEKDLFVVDADSYGIDNLIDDSSVQYIE